MNVLFTFLTVKKLCPYLEEISCMQISAFWGWRRGECGIYKTDEFYLHQSDKGFVIVAFMEKKYIIINNHLQLQLKFLPLRKNIL